MGDNDELQQILNIFNIPEININTNYWFVRTESGKFFKDFYFSKYISIGWDELSDSEQIKSLSFDVLKEQIKNIYKNDIRPGQTANQIRRFMFDMKKGDIVLIPSINSDLIAFGEILEDEYYIYENTSSELEEYIDDVSYEKCNYKKKKKCKVVSRYKKG